MSFSIVNTNNVSSDQLYSDLSSLPATETQAFTFSSITNQTVVTNVYNLSASNYFVYTNDMIRMAQNGVALSMNGVGGDRFIQPGNGGDNDNAATASWIMAGLGINDAVGKTVFLRLNHITNCGTGVLLLQNGGATSNNVQIKEFGGAASHQGNLSLANAVPQYGDVVIMVKSENVTVGSEVVSFDIVKQATPAP